MDRPYVYDDTSQWFCSIGRHSPHRHSHVTRSGGKVVTGKATCIACGHKLLFLNDMSFVVHMGCWPFCFLCSSSKPLYCSTSTVITLFFLCTFSVLSSPPLLFSSASFH
ncbi:hypothetical protein VNO78_11247 [Psophocarpus tetragonolobus]|uniref:Uncharacterized protein n=1 Tax=Psophocarpus tetragonolobus TaxID=3891 RepID=A0AAN9ST06_PSOTE